MTELNDEDRALVESTKHLLGRHRGSRISSVAAGLRTKNGIEYYGLNVDVETATVKICAEYSAIGNMVSSGESSIETLVAISEGNKRYVALPPCGKCRDMMRAFGNPFVIVHPNGNKVLKKIRLSELLPFPWREYFQP